MNGENDIIKVYIVAASAILRAGLEAVLQTDERLIIAGSATEMPPAPFVFSAGRAADALLINVERREDFTALAEFLSDGDEAANFPPAVVALLSPDFQTVERTIQLLRGGARGILPNEASGDEIAAAITAAANNLVVVPPEILEMLFSSSRTEDFFLNEELNEENDLRGDEAVESLTTRERDVLEMLVEGASNKIIAYRLNISEHTVKFHVASIFGKLAVNSRTEAVTQALRRGLILL